MIRIVFMEPNHITASSAITSRCFLSVAPSEKFLTGQSRKFLLSAAKLKDGTNRNEPRGTRLPSASCWRWRSHLKRSRPFPWELALARQMGLCLSRLSARVGGSTGAHSWDRYQSQSRGGMMLCSDHDSLRQEHQAAVRDFRASIRDLVVLVDNSALRQNPTEWLINRVGNGPGVSLHCAV
jgi:hypothetical protein